jgi:pimeloyl-ACP methyl ester carboxylesterase
VRVRVRHLLLVAALLLTVGASAAPAAVAHTRAHKIPAHKHKAPSHTRVHKNPASTQVRTIPVSFSVVNRNDTAIPCLPAVPDGKTYTVSGQLILPAGATPSGASLYVHGLGYGGYFWDFTEVPGYNYAGSEATDGHASVVIDRLGYGSSSIPSGDVSCVGSQATVLHEIVGDLRAGTYTAKGLTAAPSFNRIGLVGHSAGGELVEIEAYTFHDINALGVMEWADQFYSLGTYAAFASDAVQCLQGNVKQVGSNSTGYATFGQTTADYDSLMFDNIDPAVEADLNALRTNDPCGQIETTVQGTVFDLLNIGSIKVPVAYVHAGDDAIFQAGLPWPSIQEALYSGSPKVTNISLPGEGHAVTLERGAPQLVAAMNSWLTTNQL